MALLLACATRMELEATLGGVHRPAGHLPPTPRGRAVALRAAGRELLVLVTGVGPVNAALAAGLALGRHGGPGGEVRGLVSLGVAGSFDLSAHPLGSVRAAGMAIWPEYGLATQDGVDLHGLGIALGRLDGERVFDRIALAPGAAAAAMGLRLPDDVRPAALATVSACSGDAWRAQRMAAVGAELEAMESFPLAWAAAGEGLPYLELRSVSNRVGCRPPQDWDLPGALAALGRAAAELLGAKERNGDAGPLAK